MLTIIAILQKKPMISESESDSEDSLPSVSKNAVRRKSLSSVKVRVTGMYVNHHCNLTEKTYDLRIRI